MKSFIDRSASASERVTTHNAMDERGIRSSFPAMIDNRGAVIAQRQLMASIDSAAAPAQRVAEEEMVQGQFDPLQRVEEEEMIQGKFESVQRVEEEEMIQGRFELLQKQGNKTGLPDDLKSGMEGLSGRSLDHVKVHYHSSKPASVQAHAYAQGSDIHLASGQEKHLPHELGHVVQQMEGRVQPTTHVAGIAVNDNPALESEATALGERALLQRMVKTNAASITLKSGNVPQCTGFVDNRPAMNAQNNLIQMMQGGTSVGNKFSWSQVIQLNENIHDKVYYGHGAERGDYIQANQAPTNEHITVDTLNQAIGLSQATMGGALPMGEKRASARTAIVNRGADNTITANERQWAAWLAPDLEALLLPDMTGAQCRDDMSMDNSWFQRMWAAANPPTRHHIKDQENGWEQEAHTANLDGVARERMAWTGAQRTTHNNYVNTDNAGEDAAYAALRHDLPDPMGQEVYDRTTNWLRGEVMHRFWRLTSKMGLDFFAAAPQTPVDFVRNPDAVANGNGRRYITDSEWQHAQDQGYLDDGSVTRRDPV